MTNDKQDIIHPAHRLPERRQLPHGIPPWVQPGARFFITVNAREREINTLCRTSTSQALLDGASVYHQLANWYLWLLLIMPDHVHMIVSFGPGKGIKRTLSAWKGYLARTSGIQWQSGFFEHRLRTDEAYVEKAHYIRMNPVRKGLADSADTWPYVLEAAQL